MSRSRSYVLAAWLAVDSLVALLRSSAVVVGVLALVVWVKGRVEVPEPRPASPPAEAPLQPISSLAFFPDGTGLVSAGWDGMVRRWEVQTHEAGEVLEEGLRRLYVVAISPDGRTLAVGRDDARIVLRDLESGPRRATLEGHTTQVRSLAYAPDGAALASGDRDGTIRLWDTVTGRECGPSSVTPAPPGAWPSSPMARCWSRRAEMGPSGCGT